MHALPCDGCGRELLEVDVRDIGYKVRSVLLPFLRLDRARIRDSPDFWGPLLVVLAFALVSLYGQLAVCCAIHVCMHACDVRLSRWSRGSSPYGCVGHCW